MPVKFQDTNNGAPQLFWNALTSTSNNLGLSQLLVVEIEKDDLESVIRTSMYLPSIDGSNWSTRATDILTNNWFIGGSYCLFAQGMTTPGEDISVSRLGVEQTGAIKGLIGNSRRDPQEVTITFLETNNSFTDNIIRPWSIMASYKSLKDVSLRKTIKLTCFQKNGTNKPLAVRKQYILHGAVPVSVNSEEYNYTGDNVMNRGVKFVYNRY